MSQEWKEKLEEAQKAIEALKAEQSRKQEMMTTTPHIMNLNDDEQLCGMIVFFFGELSYCNKFLGQHFRINDIAEKR